MLIQAQPNKWSCLPTAFASVIDVPINKFIELLGHDGSDIVWPGFLQPKCYRGWHIQEIVKASYMLGYAVVEINKTVQSAPCKNVPPYNTDFTDYFFWCITHQMGVVAVTTSKDNGHVLVFNRNHLYDPATGKETSSKYYRLQDTLWLVNRINLQP